MRRRDVSDRERESTTSEAHHELAIRAHDLAPPSLHYGAESLHSDTLLLVANDPATRALARSTLADGPYRIFECPIDDLRTFARSIQIDIVVLIGKRTRAVQTKLRSGLAEHPVPAHRIVIAPTVRDARLALERMRTGTPAGGRARGRSDSAG